MSCNVSSCRVYNYFLQTAPAKLGRPLLIGEKLDEVVQKTITIVRESAGIADRHTVQCLSIATAGELSAFAFEMLTFTFWNILK